MSEPREIAYMPLEEILPARRNPKLHADLDPSFDEFDFLDAVVLDERTGQLIGGHGRIEGLVARQAAGKAAPEGVKVDGDRWLAPVQRGWRSRDDAHAEAAGIALNRYTEAGGWDFTLLSEMLGALPDNLVGSVGFSLADLDDLAGLLAKPPSLDDLAAQVGDPDPRALWPVLRVRVSSETKARFDRLTVDYDDDEIALAHVLTLAERP